MESQTEAFPKEGLTLSHTSAGVLPKAAFAGGRSVHGAHACDESLEETRGKEYNESRPHRALGKEMPTNSPMRLLVPWLAYR